MVITIGYVCKHSAESNAVNGGGYLGVNKQFRCFQGRENRRDEKDVNNRGSGDPIVLSCHEICIGYSLHASQLCSPRRGAIVLIVCG